MLSAVKRLWREEDGQGMVEYGLILALVAVAVIALLTTMGQEISAKFQEIVNELTGA